jgi:metal transporter CNNM
MIMMDIRVFIVQYFLAITLLVAARSESKPIKEQGRDLHPNWDDSSSITSEVQLKLCQIQHENELLGNAQLLLEIGTTTCESTGTTENPVGQIDISISTIISQQNHNINYHNNALLIQAAVNQWVLNTLTDSDMKVIPNSPITLQSLSSHRKLAEYYNEGTYNNPQQESVEGDNQDRSTLTNASLAILCICVAGIGAGLTIGMLSIEPLSLMIKMRCGTPAEVMQAKVLLPIILKRHRLLVTLLLINSLANEALPLFLDKIVPSHVAILLSVTAVLIFGEILPTAIFTGPNQIPLAASMSPLVTALMAILCPIAWPIAKVLDRAMKHDNTSSGISKAYAREEISALVRIMYEEQKRERQHLLNSLLSVGGGGGGADGNLSSCTSTKTKSVGSTTFSMMSMNPFSTSQKQSITTTNGSRQALVKEDQVVDGNKDEMCIISKPSSFAIDEVAMVEGALQLKTKTANDIYTPLSKVSAVEIDTILDDDTIASIYACGHSRIPVYVPTCDSSGGKTEDISSITAILLTRQLMLVDSDDQRKVSSLPLFEPICVGSDVSLIDLLNVFKHRGGGAHHAATTATKEHQTTKNFGRASHLAVVCMNPDLANQSLDKGLPIPKEACVLGIVTLEDIIEQLVQDSIVDEYDRNEYKAEQRARNAFQKWKGFATKKRLLEDAGQDQNEVANGLFM